MNGILKQVANFVDLWKAPLVKTGTPGTNTCCGDGT